MSVLLRRCDVTKKDDLLALYNNCERHFNTKVSRSIEKHFLVKWWTWQCSHTKTTQFRWRSSATMLESTPMWRAGGGFSFLFFFFRGFFCLFWWPEDVFYFGFFLGWGMFFGRDGLEHFDLRKCQIRYLPKILHAGFSDQTFALYISRNFNSV